jgi:hypothetical protein
MCFFVNFGPIWGVFGQFWVIFLQISGFLPIFWADFSDFGRFLGVWAQITISAQK